MEDARSQRATYYLITVIYCRMRELKTILTRSTALCQAETQSVPTTISWNLQDPRASFIFEIIPLPVISSHLICTYSSWHRQDVVCLGDFALRVSNGNACQAFYDKSKRKKTHQKFILWRCCCQIKVDLLLVVSIAIDTYIYYVVMYDVTYFNFDMLACVFILVIEGHRIVGHKTFSRHKN